MNEPAAPQFERELSDLRARAYGPHPDIQDDPAALARLAELESARLRGHESPGVGEDASQEAIQVSPETMVAVEAPMTGAVVVSGESVRPGSLWQGVTATPARRIGLIVGSVVVVLGVLSAATWFAAPKPEATLKPTGVEADIGTFGAVSYAPLAALDESTLRGYESYRGVQPWVAENAQGSRCLMAILGSSQLWGISCAPPEAELMIDIGAWPLDPAAYAAGLADGTVIRFHLHGDAVDAYLYPPPSAD